MGMWLLALAAVAGLLLDPWPSSMPQPKIKEVGYSDFLQSLDKARILFLPLASESSCCMHVPVAGFKHSDD